MSTNCTTPLSNETLNSRVVKALILGIIFVVALVLNVKTFVVLLKRKRQQRNVVTIFLLNLTLISALMVSQVPFNIHAIVQQGWVFGDTFCQFNGFSNAFCSLDLNFTLLCLTIDRYFAVVKPLKHRTLMTRHTAYKMLVVVYLVSLVLALIPVFGEARYRYHPRTNHCSPEWFNSCSYYTAMVVIAFIVPITGMLITYTRIFLTLRNKRVLMNKSSSSTMSSKDISMLNTDSNSMDNFEDTSTDPSGETVVKLTAHKTVVDSKEGTLEYALQGGTSGGKLARENSTTKYTIEKVTTCKTTSLTDGNFVENALEVSSSGRHLAVKDSKPKDVKEDMELSANKTVGNPKQSSVEFCLEAWSSDKHFTDAKRVATPDEIILNTPTTEYESDVSDREEIHIADNKQVSFQNSAKVSPFTIQIKASDTEGKLSSVSPVSPSRKAINFFVSRMKRQRAIRYEYKIARTGTILVLSFLVLWMPYIIAHSCFLGRCRPITVYNIATFLVYTNALANPVIYALTNKAVMQDIRKSMGRICRC